MAVTFDNLVEQIEKVAVKCGVEDLEFLAGPDWTIPLLKEELAKWKELLKQKTAEKRAVKSIIKTAKDFFVKTDKVFKGDAYIIDCKYVLPGPIAEKTLIGDMFLQIDDDFVNAITHVLLHDNPNHVYYINDIALLKQMMTISIDLATTFNSPFKPMDDDASIREKLNKLLEETYGDIDDFVTIPKQDDPQIFTRKKIFRLESPGIKDALINIQLLPTITTEEALEEVEYCLKPDDAAGGKIPVYYARIRISFSHFIVNIKYKYT